jgi:ribonuclease P protein component
MLARPFRLQKKDIDRLYKKGKVSRQDSFLVRFMPNRTGHNRFSVVISKKVLAKATQRNRAKRLMYEFLQNSKELWQTKNFDFVIFPRNYKEEKALEALNKVLSELR